MSEELKPDEMRWLIDHKEGEIVKLKLECDALRAELDKAKNKAILDNAEINGYGSELLILQQDCINKKLKLDVAKEALEYCAIVYPHPDDKPQHQIASEALQKLNEEGG